jgi:hypothetical protein
MNVSAVPYEAVDVIWDDVEKLIDPAIEMDRFNDVDSIKKRIKKRELALWIALDESGEIKAAIVTRVADYPKCRSLELEWVGGKEMSKWLVEFDETLTKYGKSLNCAIMHGGGRAGWERSLKDLGWRRETVRLVKEL